MATKAAKKATGTAIVPFMERLKAAGEKQLHAVRNSIGGMKMISTRNGRMSIDDKPIPGDEIQVIVLASMYENQFYKTSFDPDSPQAPACYAFGVVDEDNAGMKPHEEALEPQHADCATCPLNVMGSAETGRGKACKNVVRLAVMLASDFGSADEISGAEVRMLKVPVTSVRNWAKYVRHVVQDLELAVQLVATNVKLVPDKKTQFKMEFEEVGALEYTNETGEAMEGKMKEASQPLSAPYPKFEAEEGEEAAAAPTTKKFGRKAPAAPAAKGRRSKA